MNRLFFGFFLALLWPSILVLSAVETTLEADPSQNAVSSASEDVTSEVDSAIDAAQEEVRDPFSNTLPPGTETPVEGVAAPGGPEIKVELQGMGFGSKDAYAVIGGNIFYQGDEKNGIKLLEVRRREVDIIVNGGKVTVPLFPDQDLQNAKDRAKKKSANKAASAN